ncbi:uncharacterized protein BDR25DRAFT_215559, partial [Lindgomyces ingoldianus]
LEGIISLTTNLVGSIDQAFKSRIYLSLSNPRLNPQARRRIWENFIKKGFSEYQLRWVNNKFLDTVAKEEIRALNPEYRRMAYALAVNAMRGAAGGHHGGTRGAKGF